MKNPYDNTTPEWQLWENMTNNLHLVASYTQDADRYMQMAAHARDKAEKFRVALERLTQ